jgi:hypothetical protein
MPTVAKLYVQRATVKAWRMHPWDAGKDRHVLQFVEGYPADERERPGKTLAKRAPTTSGPETNQRPAMVTVSVQEYDIADLRPVFGKDAERTCSTEPRPSDEIRASVRS